MDELVEKILTLIRTVNEQEMSSLSGDTLSRLAVRLAAYKAGLGEAIPIAKRRRLDAEADYKLAKANSYAELRNAGKGSTDANELKSLGADAALREYNQRVEEESQLVTLSTDCHDLIDSIKSRLISLQSERNENNVY